MSTTVGSPRSIPSAGTAPAISQAIRFDALCRTARALFDVAAVSVSLQDESFLWIELADETGRAAWEAAAAALAQSAGDRPLWVADTRQQDSAGLPGIAALPALRFFAAAPFGPAGAGRLCLFDTRPHAGSAEASRRLGDLAAIADQSLNLLRAAQAATQREAEFRQLTEVSTDTIVRGDLDGIRRYVSPSVKTLLGYEPAELLDRKASELTHPDDLPAFAALMRKVREGKLDIGVSEQRQRHKDGSWVWLEAFVRLTRDETTGAATGYVSSVRGIGQRKALEVELERRASHDALTGLPNRQLFETHLLKAAARMRRNGGEFSLLFMDIDNFKWVNDSLGHQAGDAVLREAAQCFLSVLRTEDVVARMGGDEFTALIETGRAEAAILAQRLIAALSRSFQYEGQAISIGLSIGIACAPANGLIPEKLLACADHALYEAKAAGKNTFRFFVDGDSTGVPPNA